MKEPFIIRAKKAILQAVQRRLYLISAGKSKSFVTYDQCTTIREQLSNLNSNRQLAEFTTKNADLIANIIAANNHNATNEFKKIVAEAAYLKKLYNQPVFKIEFHWNNGQKETRYHKFENEKEAHFVISSMVNNHGSYSLKQLN